MSETNGKYPSAYIPDGYTESGYVAGIPRLYPPVAFEYRPMLPGERARALKLSDTAQYADAADAEVGAANAILKHIVRWDVVDDKGAELPVSVKSLLHLRPSLNTQIFNIVLGLRPSDPTPKEMTGDDQQPNKYQSLMEGVPATEVAAKNS